MIRDQGEAAKAADAIAAPFRNTADDPDAELSVTTRSSPRSAAQRCRRPTRSRTPADYTDDDRKRRSILIADFTRFTAAVSQLCAGRRPPDFETLMVTLGGDILACWKSGVTPQFTPRQWAIAEDHAE